MTGTPPSAKIRDEEIKARVTFLNGLANSLITVGAFAPLAARLFGLPGAGSGYLVFWTVVLVVAGAWAIHTFAVSKLKRLSP